jgi:MarR family transcriptional regulator, lower aerobic nicotinate degradation pathway regulator
VRKRVEMDRSWSLDEAEQHPGDLIRRLQQIAVGIFMDETKQFDITPVQYKALRAIHETPDIPKSYLADAIALDRSTIGELVLRLESRGLVTRTTAAGDKRVKKLRLTRSGEALLSKAEPIVKRAKDRILAPLSKADRQRFKEMLVQLVEENNEFSRAPLKKASAQDDDMRFTPGRPPRRP